ncbi:GH25 family lysozyme [Scopulibacillus cellulosilyticus]|uniref:GH25 family lysozyme n=1 Tax=Scopulibacillus cellulosilyticus TaxID=2665665 RepID=A0ABW2Q5Q5_9BACL
MHWEKVRQEGIDFVFIKATEGHTFVDKMHKEYYKGAVKAGIAAGFYHFARFKNKMEAKKEAEHFIQTVKAFPADLPHVLDLEVASGASRSILSQAALVFLDLVKEKTGQDIMLYTYTIFAKRHLNSLLKYIPLWIAHYGVDRPGDNGIWERWQVFQYSDKGRINGIQGNVDLNVMMPSLPDHHREAKSNSDKKFYKIKKGDTFWDLETKNGFQHGTLEKLNPGIDPRKLQIGQNIVFPK